MKADQYAKPKWAAMALAVPLMAGLTLPALAGGLTEPVLEPAPIMADPVPVMAPSGEWGGAYVGAQLGYGDIGTDAAGLDGNGAIGGVHAGYRFDFGQFVAGAELSYDAADIDLNAGGDTLDSVTRLKLTAGYDLGSTLIYASGGAARAKVSVGGADLSDNGYFLGIGADYALTDNWTLGAEVMEHRFDNFDGTGIDVDATTIQAKVGFRF